MTNRLIGCAIRVHTALGPGLLESAYEACLCRALSQAGLSFRRQVPLTVSYEGLVLDCAYRMDLVVEDQVIAELKCIEEVLPIHRAQLLTYLRLSGQPLGLLINFNVARVKGGIRRVAVAAA